MDITPTPQYADEGIMLLDMDPKEAALAAYELAIQLAPREAILRHHKGHALAQLGRHVEAQQAYEEARRLGYNA